MTHTPGDGLKATELMVGNYLHDRLGNLCKVQKIEHDGNIDAPTIKGAITAIPNKPIPLTEDWLKAFGFEEEINQITEISRTYIKGNIWFFQDNETKEYSVNFFNDCVVKFQYVHQLQNLYYCLTGTQLIRTP